MAAVPTGTYNFKVVLLGEGCVGKTSLLLRFTEDKFNDKHLTTLQATFLNKKININGKRVNLSIWDTAGQEKFHALGPIYYRGSQGAILVYDITDADSFLKCAMTFICRRFRSARREHLQDGVAALDRRQMNDIAHYKTVKTWVKELKKMLGGDIALMIAGNKIDLEHERTVPFEEAESYANLVGAVHLYTSAKQNYGVEELFLELANHMVDRHDKAAPKDKKSNRTSSLVIVDDEPAATSSCCSGFSGNS